MKTNKNKVEERINHNYYKQIADKITQLLDKIHDSQLSSKRWVWELMQNAKDVPNKFGRVSIRIELWADKLVFSHNGDYFTDGNITGLIQQVSSKDSANEGEVKQTGKFGTGFITTHLLSNVIDVKGVVKNPNTDEYQNFTLCLDRSARKSEELIKSITDNLEWIKGLDTGNYDEFPIADNYENRKEDSFDTSFIYHLDENSIQAAQVGLEDLINTLPITMVSLQEIKSVEVINHVSNERQVYVCNNNILERNDNHEIIKSVIVINEVKKYYLTYKTYKERVPSVALSIETELDGNGRYALVKRSKSQPVLFRDFPLIGSENFYFPYMLNGFDFDPTESRNGILLNSDQPKPKKNREIIEKAVDAVIAFNEWLVRQGAINIYLLASSQKPKPKEPWDDTYAKPWIESLQKQWRNRLLTQRLVESPTGYSAIENIKVPDYGNKEANRTFYTFLKDFMQDGILPLQEQQEEWSDVICAEYPSWNANLKYTKQDFFEDLQRVGCIANLSVRLRLPEEECYTWLNNLYKFVEGQGDEEYFEKYPVIPNQSGEFCLLNTLCSDSSQRIPNELKDICMGLLDKNLYDELFSEKTADGVFKKKREYTLDNLIRDINKKIREAYEEETMVSHKEWSIISKGVYEILTIKTNEVNDRQVLRDKMYAFVRNFADVPKQLYIENMPEALWKEADLFILKTTPLLIERNALSLNDLGSKLLTNPQNHSEEECILWINEYLAICKAYNFAIIYNKKFFPNQKKELKSLNDLRYDQDIDDGLKELYTTSTTDDLRAKLLDRRIMGFEQHNSYTVKDLYEAIKKTFDSNAISDSKKLQIAIDAIVLIPKEQNERTSDNMTIYVMAQTLYSNLQRATILNNASGFYWEIFIGYVLKYICKEIAESINIKTLSERIKKTESETLEYVDDVIDFAETRFGKRYSKIVEEECGVWVNQNGDFCVFSAIRKDDNVNPILIQIARNEVVGKDYKEILLNSDARCNNYISSKVSNRDILLVIDDSIKQYHTDRRNLQNPTFADLIFKLDGVSKKYSDFKDNLTFFDAHRDRLIVGSIGDERTLSLVGSIVSNPQKMELLNKHTEKEIDSVLKVLEDATLSQIVDEFPNFDFKKLLEKLRTQGNFNLDRVYNDAENERKLEIGDKGEAFVYQQLLKQFPKESITWSNLCEPTEQKDRTVEMEGECYRLKTTSHDYDFRVMTDKGVITIEVKSTIGKLEQSSIYPLYFETKEWKHVYSNNNIMVDNIHLIARVFDVEGSPSVYYLRQTTLVE